MLFQYEKIYQYNLPCSVTVLDNLSDSSVHWLACLLCFCLDRTYLRKCQGNYSQFDLNTTQQCRCRQLIKNIRYNIPLRHIYFFFTVNQNPYNKLTICKEPCLTRFNIAHGCLLKCVVR